jgi:hemerythrin-like metal-binding protein
MDITMPKLAWDESFSVGVPKMDADDKQIFTYLNELTDSMMGKSDAQRFERVLVSLLNFTVCHMLNEEVMLFKSGYPMFHIHVKEHEKYLREVRGLYVRFLGGGVDSKILSAELISVLTELLQEHILKSDKQYGKFLVGDKSTVLYDNTTRNLGLNFIK